MTKTEVDDCRRDAVKLVLLTVVNELGPLHGRYMTQSTILKLMQKIRNDLYKRFRGMKGLDEIESRFTWNCLDNILSIFEAIMNFKEGPNMIDLLRIGLGSELGY